MSCKFCQLFSRVYIFCLYKIIKNNILFWFFLGTSAENHFFVTEILYLEPCAHVTPSSMITNLEILHLERTSTANGFGLFNFDLEYLKRVQSSEPFHTKIPLILLLLRQTGCTAQTVIFSAKPVSKSVGGSTIVLWITARE
jgi:hypothetical protein